MSVPANIITQSFNQDFCEYLEYHLSRAFQKASSNKKAYFWCDGILMPEIIDQISVQRIITKRKIETSAWMGFSGQDKYHMTINLGQKAFENLSKGLSLIESLPSDESLNWVILDIENHKIGLNLQ